MAILVDDRVLARVARDAIAWNGGADPAALADIALGQAVVALRVMGIAETPEITRAVGEDIAAIIADPDLLASARRPASAAPPLARRLAA